MTFPYDPNTLDYILQFQTFYNGNAYNAATNPGGLAAGGHRVNFIPILQKYGTVADSVADAADFASLQASAAATSAAGAAASQAALIATSTTSVLIGVGTKNFTTQSGKDFPVGTFVEAVSNASPTTHYLIGQVASYSSVTGALTIQVLSGGFGGSGSRADWTIYGRAGPVGAVGSTGATGAPGTPSALQWLFDSSTADADPSNGFIRVNNATYSSVTFLFIDNLDRFGATQTAFLDSFDDSTNTVNRGILILTQIDTPANAATFAITGSPGTVEDASGYRRVPVSFLSSNGTFTPGSSIGIGFYRSGNKGTDGAGAGDTISDITSSVLGRLVVYNTTDGKHITQAAVGLGTSGAAVGRLDTVNTWSGAQSINAKVDLQQDWATSGDITPAQIVANTNDYAPAGGAAASVFRLSTDASRDLTGLVGGYRGRKIAILNVGNSDIVLRNEASSTAANRFLLGIDFTLQPQQAMELIYDSTASRWRQIAALGVSSVGGLKNVVGVTNGLEVSGANIQMSPDQRWTTGDAKLTYKTIADTGWIMANDGSIGDATSGATTRANADTSALFALLYNNVTRTFAQTVTIQIASPAFVNATAHGLSVNQKVVFSTTGALPTGIVAGTSYYIIATGFSANFFQISLTLGGAAVNATGTQSGTHTLTATFDLVLQNSAGVQIARTSAAADFAAHARLFIPATLGRALAIAGAGSGLTNRPLGETRGAETETQTILKMASHNHPGSSSNGLAAGGANSNQSFSGTDSLTGALITIAPQGGGVPLDIMQPSSFINAMIKL